jgi:hypothetical protein
MGKPGLLELGSVAEHTPRDNSSNFGGVLANLQLRNYGEPADDNYLVGWSLGIIDLMKHWNDYT